MSVPPSDVQQPVVRTRPKGVPAATSIDVAAPAPLQVPDLRGGSGFPTLFYKELLRFYKVSFQTVAAPVVTALLYLLVFAHVLEDHVRVYDQIPYVNFLVPGLVMMSMLQNAFSNASSSLIQSRVTGNLVFVLLPPLSYLDFYGAYVLASVVRGLVVGFGVWLITLLFAGPMLAYPGWMLTFAVLACAVMATLGLVAGIWAEKFDQIAAFQNFLIMPATFLSGVFYSINSLPPFWQAVSHWNPVFYAIDGFRYGFFGVSDASPWHSLAVVGGVFLVLATCAMRLLASGYKLRS